MKRPELLCTLALLGAGLVLPAPAAEGPAFQEIYEVLRQHASGLKPEQLERAAVNGLLEQVSSTAWLVPDAKPAATATNAAPLSSSALLDEHYGYLRIARVEAPLPQQFSAALGRLTATNRIKGLVLDLRYATGTDYASAAGVADQFLGSVQALLDWGEGEKKSTDKTNAFRQPVAVLVNRFTTGAAEALAAVLRQKDIALVIGTNTAGQTSVTRDFPLRSGAVLRVATQPVKGPDGSILARLQPDIRIEVSPEDERAYFLDAYKMLPRPGLAAGSLPSLTLTNKPRRRINEAELVRMLRDGETPEDEAARARTVEPARPVITDPALSRAVDLLKALTVVRPARG